MAATEGPRIHLHLDKAGREAGRKIPEQDADQGRGRLVARGVECDENATNAGYYTGSQESGGDSYEDQSEASESWNEKPNWTRIRLERKAEENERITKERRHERRTRRQSRPKSKLCRSISADQIEDSLHEDGEMVSNNYSRHPPRAKSAPPLRLEWSDDSDQSEDEQEDDMDAGERVGSGKSEPETGSLKFEHKRFKNTQSPKEADFYLNEQRARLLNEIRYQCHHEPHHFPAESFYKLQNEIAECTESVLEQIDVEKQSQSDQVVERLLRCQEKILDALWKERESWQVTKTRWIDERKRLKDEIKLSAAKSVSAADRKMNELKRENRKLKGMIVEQRQAVFLRKYAQTHKDSQEWDYDISDAADDVAQVRVELLRSRIEFVSRRRGEVSRPNVKERILEELHRILNAEWARDQEEMAKFYHDRGLSLLMKDAEAAVARRAHSRNAAGAVAMQGKIVCKLRRWGV